MKCTKCGKSYASGSHYCPNCGSMTAEGELSLALTDFTKATKHLAHETVRIGKTSIEKARPIAGGAIERIAEATTQICVAAKPAGQKAMAAAASALQLAAQAAEQAATELRKVAKRQ